MAITVLSAPEQKSISNPFAPYAHGVYGLIKIVLEGLQAPQTKYILRVYDADGVLLADIRQAANQAGTAVFDIRKICQSALGIRQVGTSGFTNLSTGIGINHMWGYVTYEWGYEMGGEAVILPQDHAQLRVCMARLFYGTSSSPYLLNAYNLGNNQEAPVFQSGRVFYDEETVGCIYAHGELDVFSLWPTEINPYEKGYQFFNEPVKFVKIPYNTIDNKIEAVFNFTYPDSVWLESNLGTISGFYALQGLRYVLYDSSGTKIFDDIRTTTATVNQTAVSMPTGPRGLSQHLFNVLGTQAGVNMMENTAYYYAFPVVQQDPICGPVTHEGWSDIPAAYPIMYVFEEQKCDDFQPTTVRWLNSVGNYDSYIFTKRWDLQETIERQSYYAGSLDYSGPSYDRFMGSEMVHAQTGKLRVTLRTDWLTEGESQYLKQLIESPHVLLTQQGMGPYTSSIPSTYAKVETSTWDYRDFRRNKLYQLEVTFVINSQINLAGVAY
jgi:hypothetical protein